MRHDAVDDRHCHCRLRRRRTDDVGAGGFCAGGGAVPRRLAGSPRRKRAVALSCNHHRRERPGHARASVVHVWRPDESSGPALAAVVTFLRDMPGMEALGISHAVLYRKLVPQEHWDPSVIYAQGVMTVRLARRTMAKVPALSAEQQSLAQDLETVTTLGIRMVPRDALDTTQGALCDDGEALRTRLTLEGDPVEEGMAAWLLTDDRCVPESVSPARLFEYQRWRADVLSTVPSAGLPPWMIARISSRLAEAHASIAGSARHHLGGARTCRPRGDRAPTSDPSQRRRRREGLAGLRCRRPRGRQRARRANLRRLGSGAPRGADCRRRLVPRALARLRFTLRRPRGHGRVLGQGDRDESRPPDRAGGAVHGRALGRPVPQDAHLPARAHR